MQPKDNSILSANRESKRKEISRLRDGESKYKLMAAVIVAAVALAGLFVFIADDSRAFDGNGSQGNPYVLYNETDLAKLSEGLGAAGNNVWFVLGSNITVTGAWTPIGTATNAFQGHLDAKGHTIAINTVVPSQYVGFFGYISNAEVKNLRLVLGSSISSLTSPVNIYMGSLAGYINASTVHNVIVEGAGIELTISGNHQINAGGLAGYVSNSTITYTTSKVNIYIGGGSANNNSYAGGLIGYGTNNAIDASFSEGEVYIHVGQEQVFAGGFIGYTEGGSITRCGETGNVTAYNNINSSGQYARVGGFAGYTNTPISYAYSRGNVEYDINNPNAQGGYIGGFAGENVSSIVGVYSTGSVYTYLAAGNGGRAEGYLAGIVGSGGSVADSYYNRDHPINPAPTNTSGTGLNDSQMKNENNFGPGWKNGDWFWNEGYPELTAFSFTIRVTTDPSPSYGTVRYSKDSPTTSASPVYTSPLTGNLWSTFYFQASAASGKVFLHWSGGDDQSTFSTTTYVVVPAPSGSEPVESRIVTAYFEDQAEAALLTLNATPAGSGTFTYNVEGVPGTFSYTTPQYFAKGTKITLTTAPTGSYVFSFWASNEGWNSSLVTGTIELQENTVLNAVFTQASDPTFTLTAGPSGTGSFTYEVQAPSSSWIGPINYSGPIKIPSGYSIRATAISDYDSGYLFVQGTGWSGPGATDGQGRRSVTGITSNTDLTAAFTRGAIISAGATPGHGGTFRFSTDGLNYYPHDGDKVTVLIGSQLWIDADAVSGYTFGFWADQTVGNKVMYLSPTGDADLSAYFYLTAGSHILTTTVVGEGKILISVEGVPAPVQTTGTRAIRISPEDNVVITAEDGVGEFMFYTGTVSTENRTINVSNLDENYQETAFFTFGTATSNLTIDIAGSGYATIQVLGWSQSIDTRAFGGGPIPVIRIGTGAIGTITPHGISGVYQNMVISDSTGTTFFHEPSLDNRTILRDTDITINFTETSGTYVLGISATTGNMITYSIGGAPPIAYTGTAIYNLYVDDYLDTEIGYIPGPGLFQHFAVDREYPLAAYSLPGPEELFNDHQSHTIRAIFTDPPVGGTYQIYTLTVRVHGIGSITLGIGSDPLETISANGPTVTRTITPDYYKEVNIAYGSGNHQYSVCTLLGGASSYDFGNGVLISQPLVIEGEYIVDVYFLNGSAAGYTLDLRVVGDGKMTFDIGGGPVPLTTMSGLVSIPLLLSDTATVNGAEEVNHGKLQGYTHEHGMPSVTDVILLGPLLITSAGGDQTVTAYFTESSSPHTITMGTYGSGYVTFTLDDIMGRYRSPNAGETFVFPIDSSDNVHIGQIADGGRFQFYVIEGVTQFQPQALSGVANHAVFAYFTDTNTTYNLTIGVAGSGVVIAEIFDGASSPSYTSVIIEHSSGANRTIPLDMNDRANVRARESLGHFQYFSAGTSPAVAVQGEPLGAGLYGYPDEVTSATVIDALFTDNKANDYQLILNVDPDGKGTLTYQIGGDPPIRYRNSSPRIIWIDPYENTTIGYDDTGIGDGYFQYFVYEKNGSGAESTFSIPQIGGSSGDVHAITAKFTSDKTNVSEHILSTTGNGFITFQRGSDPVGKFNSVLYYGVNEEPKILYVDKSDPNQTTVNMEEYNPLEPMYEGYRVDGGALLTDDPMPNLVFGSSADCSIILYFDTSTFVYTLTVETHGGGKANIQNGTNYYGVTNETHDVFVYRNVTITAVEDGGFFQAIRITRDGGATYTWHSSPYMIPFGTVAPDGTVMADIYFTSSYEVYYLNLDSEAGGTVTYDIDGTGVRRVPYQETDVPVDVSSSVEISYENDGGKFQYFIYEDDSDYELYTDSFAIDSNTIAQDVSVNVAAYFTATQNTYELSVMSVGNGSVTFAEARSGRETEVLRGGPYTIPIDVGTAVTVGWQESGGTVRFQYLECTDNSSNVTTHRADVMISGVLGGTYSATAYFTQGQQYSLSISTNTSSLGAIGVRINGGNTVWHTGTLAISIPVSLSSAAELTKRIDSAIAFEFFILNNAVIFKDGLNIPGDAAPAQNGTVTAIAYFSNDASSYTVNLSTVGAGSITYTIGTYQSGSFKTVSSPGLEELEFRLNTGTSFSFTNAPEGSARFTYYIYTLDSSLPTVRTQAQPAPPMSLLQSAEASPHHKIVAKFTGTDYYTLALSASGGGIITYDLGDDPTATYAGVSALNLYVDRGTDVTVGYQETRPGSFQWFVQTAGGSAPLVTRGSPTVLHENQSIQALFVGGEAYYVTLKTDGDGQAILTTGGYTYTYRGTGWSAAGEKIPIPAGISASIDYLADEGQHFQQYDHEVVGLPTQSLSTAFSVIGSTDEEHTAIAYFTTGTNHYSINLSRIGIGQVTFKIRDQGTVTVNNSVSSPYILYLSENDWVNIGNAPGLSALQYYNYAGSLFDEGPILTSELNFPANTTGLHSVTAVFTNASAAAAYTVTLDTVGGGYITFHLSTMDAGKYAKYQSAGTPYVLRIDNGENVAIGYEEGDGHFIGFVRSPQTVLTISETISLSNSSAITAYFTNDKVNVLSADLSTIGIGYITYTYRDLGVSGQYRSASPGSERTIYANIGDELMIGHSGNVGEFFNAFIEDGNTVIGVNEITYSPAAAEHHDVTAVFTITSTVYETTLATAGSGSLIFEIHGSISGRYVGSGWTIYTDITNTLYISNEPNASFFQYFGISEQGIERVDVNPSIVIPAGSTGTRMVTANFTEDAINVFTLELSTVGEGYITYRSRSGAIGDFKSSASQEKLVMHIDNGASLNFGARNGSGTFRFMIYDSMMTVVDVITIMESGGSHTLKAYFTNSSSDALYLTIGRTGMGEINVDIATGGLNVPTILNFTGSIVMERTDSVTLTAIDSVATYRFTRWTSTNLDAVNGVAVDTVSFTVNENSNVSAYFSLADNVYALELTAGAGGGASFSYGIGTTTVTGTVAEGTKTFSVLRGREVTITAEPLNSSNAFTNWTSAAVADINNMANSTIRFMIEADSDAAANFSAVSSVYTFELTAGAGGKASFTYGAGASAVTGTVAEGTEAFSIPCGEELTLAADPLNALSYAFVNWTSTNAADVNGVANRAVAFTISKDSNAAAKFSALNDVYTLELTAEAGGKASFTYGAGASAVTGTVAEGTEVFSIPCGKELTLAADPLNASSAFTNWASTNVAGMDGVANRTAAFMISEDSDITALFCDADDVWAFTLTATAGGSATFTCGSKRGLVHAGTSQNFCVMKGSLLDIAAEPSSAAYLFQRWMQDAEGEPAAFSVTILSDYSATAAFVLSDPSLPSYSITASSDDGSDISPGGAVSVQKGSSGTFTFSAKAGYEITAVYVDGVAIPSEAAASGTYTFSDVLSNHTIRVASRVQTHITVYVEIESGKGAPMYHIGPSANYGPIERSQQIDIHSDLYISLMINKGYEFVRWTGDVESENMELHYSDADHDIYLVAHLKEEEEGWAAVNLLLAVLAVFAGVFAVMVKRDGITDGEREKPGTRFILRIAALVLGLISLAIFLVTEDWGLGIGAVDSWTLLSAALFVAVLAMVAFSFRPNKD